EADVGLRRGRDCPGRAGAVLGAGLRGGAAAARGEDVTAGADARPASAWSTSAPAGRRPRRNSGGGRAAGGRGRAGGPALGGGACEPPGELLVLPAGPRAPPRRAPLLPQPGPHPHRGGLAGRPARAVPAGPVLPPSAVPAGRQVRQGAVAGASSRL